MEIEHTVLSTRVHSGWRRPEGCISKNMSCLVRSCGEIWDIASICMEARGVHFEEHVSSTERSCGEIWDFASQRGADRSLTSDQGDVDGNPCRR
jgi:hypothetical protein